MCPRGQNLCHMYLCIIFGGVCGLPRPIFLSLENAPTPLVIASYDLVEQYCGAARHVMGAFGVVRFHGHAAKWRRKSSLGNGGGVC